MAVIINERLGEAVLIYSNNSNILSLITRGRKMGFIHGRKQKQQSKDL